MKYIYSVILFAVLSNEISGQIMIDNLIMPVPGDSVELFVDPAPGSDIVITEPGGDEFWFWTLDNTIRQSVVFGINDRTDLYPFANIKASTATFDNYYDIRTDEWLLTGQVGQDPFGFGLNVNLFYLPPYREYYAPVGYQDSSLQSFDLYTGIPLFLVPDSILEELPLVPDSMRARIVTQNVDKVDSWGLLHINEGEEDVLRVRQERRISVRIEAKISILPWTDVTDLLFNYLNILPFEVDLNDTIVSYQFLSPGYVLPLAQVTLDSLGGVGIITYQQPIVSSLSDVQQVGSIAVYPNPASDVVTVDLTAEPDVQMIRLYDISGRLVEEVRVEFADVIGIPLGEVSTGPILLTTWNSAGMLMGMTKLSVVR